MAGILIVDQIQNSSNTLLINSGALAANTVGTSQIQSGISLSGNIGVGQSSPAYALDVKSSSSGDTVRFNGNGGIPSFLYTDSVYFGLADASSLGGNAIYGNHSSNYVSIQTNGTEKVRVDTSGNLNMKTSNAGIVFNNGSASVNSTLNDYETGTWTPTLVGSSSNPTCTYAFNYGYYTKIGNTVYIQAFVGLSAISGGSGSLQMNGLPFYCSASTRFYPTFSCNVQYLNLGASLTNIQPYMNVNTNYLAFLCCGNNIAWQNPTVSGVASNFSIMLSGTYLAQF